MMKEGMPRGYGAMWARFDASAAQRRAASNRAFDAKVAAGWVPVTYADRREAADRAGHTDVGAAAQEPTP